jgi:hypothetical protein
MRQRMIGFGFLCWAVWLYSGQSHVRAESLTFTETSGFGFVQTDFGPGVNVGGNDPLTFNKFNPGSAQIPAGAVLEKVDVSFNWGFRSQLSASFPSDSSPASSVTINALGAITLGRPDVSITGPGADSSLFLFPTQTFQNSASFSSSTAASFTTTPNSIYFHSLPTGYVLPPEDQPLALRDAGSPLVASITPGSPDFAKFLGAGTVTFDVVATAGYNVPNTSGNASGTSLTSAFPEVTLTYTYTAIPEPSSLVLMGMGMGGFLVARWFRRSRAAF